MSKKVSNAKPPLHHSPQLFVDNSWYFVSAHTLGTKKPLKNEKTKAIWTSKLHPLIKEYDVRLKAYVVLDDHYHILCFFKNSDLIPKFINRLNGTTSRQINLLENRLQRKIWHNYWERIIRDEDEFWKRFNYIHYNPVKHGYVRHPEKWKYSSYKYYIGLKGEEWMKDCWESYPVIEFDFED